METELLQMPFGTWSPPEMMRREWRPGGDYLGHYNVFVAAYLEIKSLELERKNVFNKSDLMYSRQKNEERCY